MHCIVHAVCAFNATCKFTSFGSFSMFGNFQTRFQIGFLLSQIRLCVTSTIKSNFCSHASDVSSGNSRHFQTENFSFLQACCSVKRLRTCPQESHRTLFCKIRLEYSLRSSCSNSRNCLRFRPSAKILFTIVISVFITSVNSLDLTQRTSWSMMQWNEWYYVSFQLLLHLQQNLCELLSCLVLSHLQ